MNISRFCYSHLYRIVTVRKFDRLKCRWSRQLQEHQVMDLLAADDVLSLPVDFMFRYFSSWS